MATHFNQILPVFPKTKTNTKHTHMKPKKQNGICFLPRNIKTATVHEAPIRFQALF